MEVHIEGLEDALRRIIREELVANRDGWLNAKESAAYLGISRASLHNVVSRGDLPRQGEKGHALRFRRADLDAYQARRRS